RSAGSIAGGSRVFRYLTASAGTFQEDLEVPSGGVPAMHRIMSNVSYYTAEGLKKLKDELNHLRDVERPRASQAIADARDKGDLSENAEYDAAKEAQGLLELKISKLEET